MNVKNGFHKVMLQQSQLSEVWIEMQTFNRTCSFDTYTNIIDLL